MSTIERGEPKIYKDTLTARLAATYERILDATTRLESAKRLRREAVQDFHSIVTELEGRTAVFTGQILQYDHEADISKLETQGHLVASVPIEIKTVFANLPISSDLEASTSVYALGYVDNISYLARIDQIHEIQ